MSYNYTTFPESLGSLDNGQVIPRSLILSVVFATVLGLWFLRRCSQLAKDPHGDASSLREPPTLKSSIPFIGHLIGMLRWQVGYMHMLSCKVPSWPAFTLKIFSSRIYVICDPSLIQAVFRNEKSFDFGSFVVESSERAFNISGEGMKIMRGENASSYDPKGPYLNGIRGDCFLNDNHRLMVEMLSKGDSLTELNAAMLRSVATAVNDLDSVGDSFSVYSWMRDALTIATSNSLYGPENPLMKDASLIEHLWNFEEKMTLLMLKFLPRVIAKDAYKGRIAIRKAFASYYSSSDHLTGSHLILARLKNAKTWGFTAEDIANFEISTLYVATTNTVATSFWMLCHILSQPSLLDNIRSEVHAITSIQDGKANIDSALLMTSCPLLVSCFHETLRHVISATSVRSVVSDVQLSSSSSPHSFSINSPAVIQLPSGVTHTSPAIWGPSVAAFDPHRFLPSTKDSLDKDTRKMQKDGFFPFGGGKHLCPGRHLATMEVLAFVAGLCMSWDFEGSGPGGMVVLPEKRFQKLGTAVRKPVSDVSVKIRKREGWESTSIAFEHGTAGNDFL